MPYRAPAAEFRFILDHIVAFSDVTETDRFAEATPDTVAAILDESAKLSDEIMAPLQRIGDTAGAVLENGVVRTSPGYREAYAQIAEGGWVGMAGDPEYGGMGLPFTLTAAFNDSASGQVADLMSEAGIMRLDLLLAATAFSIGSVAFLCIAVFVVTLATVFLSFVIGVGPIFVLCLAWRPTQRFFDSWLSMVLNAVVLTWFAFFALGLSAYVGREMFLAIQAVQRRIQASTAAQTVWRLDLRARQLIAPDAMAPSSRNQRPTHWLQGMGGAQRFDQLIFSQKVVRHTVRPDDETPWAYACPGDIACPAVPSGWPYPDRAGGNDVGRHGEYQRPCRPAGGQGLGRTQTRRT